MFDNKSSEVFLNNVKLFLEYNYNTCSKKALLVTKQIILHGLKTSQLLISTFASKNSSQLKDVIFKKASGYKLTFFSHIIVTFYLYAFLRT